MLETAPNFCPNCGCQSSEFTLSDVEETVTQESPKNIEKKEEPKKKGFSFLGCVGIAVGVIIVLFLILSLAGGSSSAESENYNDNSRTHQILAKNYFVDKCIKPSMYDPKSYVEEDYKVTYDTSKSEYFIIVTCRGKNAFGNYVNSTYTGSVKFTYDNRVQCQILSN